MITSDQLLGGIFCRHPKKFLDTQKILSVALEHSITSLVYASEETLGEARPAPTTPKCRGLIFFSTCNSDLSETESHTLESNCVCQVRISQVKGLFC